MKALLYLLVLILLGCATGPGFVINPQPKQRVLGLCQPQGTIPCNSRHR